MSPSVADFEHPRLALLRIIEPRGGRIVINGNSAKGVANDSSLWIKSLHVIMSLSLSLILLDFVQMFVAHSDCMLKWLRLDSRC